MRGLFLVTVHRGRGCLRLPLGLTSTCFKNVFVVNQVKASLVEKQLPVPAENRANEIAQPEPLSKCARKLFLDLKIRI